MWSSAMRTSSTHQNSKVSWGTIKSRAVLLLASNQRKPGS
jgi:hypothetical protein